MKGGVIIPRKVMFCFMCTSSKYQIVILPSSLVTSLFSGPPCPFRTETGIPWCMHWWDKNSFAKFRRKSMSYWPVGIRELGGGIREYLELEYGSTWVGLLSQRHFPKGDFPSDNFPSGNFTNLQFPKRQLLKGRWGTLRRRSLQWGPSAAARMG